MKKLIRKKKAYRLDHSEADAVRKAARDKKRSEAKNFELTGNIVLRALEFLDAEAIVLNVANQITAETEAMPVIRLTHAAKLLNVSYQTFWRWSSETKLIPMPVLVDNSQGREYAVYHLEEIRVMIGTIGEHLRRFKYYRADHTSTRKEVFAKIEALRATNFKVEGSKTHGTKIKGPRARKVIRKKASLRSRSG